jgi:glycerol uptake facilitator-like aquaporin
MVHWPTPPTADVDCDGEIGAGDVAILLSLWGLHTPTGDLNGDCVIDARDLGLLLAAWSSP